MKFKTVSIIKHPQDTVWQTMLNHFPLIGDHVDDIESIVNEREVQLSNGSIKMVNIWTANPPLPDVISRFIKPEMLVWTDTAVWDKQEMICNWTIHSHYFKNNMVCSGFTKFDSAIGGKGSRLSFEGNIEFSKDFSLLTGIMDKMVSKTIESVISKMVPNNFQKITAAVGNYLDKK